jgi:hypothetical protein
VTNLSCARTVARSIYDEIGVRSIINARGATTAVGGTLMSPQVLAAMADAAQAFVVLDDLNAKVGKRLADIAGADAGYVTSGSAAGMVLAAAACIAGNDPVRVRRLPDRLWAAIDLFIKNDHEAEHRLHVSEAEIIASAVAGRPDARCLIESDWEAWPAPVVRIFPSCDCWRPEHIRAAMLQVDPPVHLDIRHGGLLINTHCLLPGDAEIIRDHLSLTLDKLSTGDTGDGQ